MIPEAPPGFESCFLATSDLPAVIKNPIYSGVRILLSDGRKIQPGESLTIESPVLWVERPIEPSGFFGGLVGRLCRRLMGSS